ncbi:MAG TPA: hypothetical protein VGH20_16340 [Myxococcales bacterium]|jgi:hypothetical protein
MEAWKPVLKPGVDLRGLPLTPEEGFVASRLDGNTDLHGISQVTGLPAASIGVVLDKLVAHGAVARPSSDRATPDAETAGATTDAETGRAPSDGESDRAAPEAESSADPAEPDAAAPTGEGIHRKRYETGLRELTSEERAALAKGAIDPDLSALCFDPLAGVIQSLLENQRFGLVQARLVAANHRTPQGLEALCSRSAFAADGGVRRALLRNPQLSPALLRRLFGSRRSLEQFKLAVSRDLPEQTKGAARELLRSRFAQADADERVEVIVKSEGRCLSLLAGVPVDGKTAALLCSRTYSSTLFVQNLSRWSAAPGQLIAHLLKQEIVKRSPPLRTQLLRHPNARTADSR